MNIRRKRRGWKWFYIRKYLDAHKWEYIAHAFNWTAALITGLLFVVFILVGIPVIGWMLAS